MSLTVEAVYEDGVLKLAQPLPPGEHERVQVTVEAAPAVKAALDAVTRSYGLIGWTGSHEELDYLIDSIENDPLEGP
jgi:predicted DNA-binding antitoxin AbrB/MazE fold protein